jgi:hypothetical protein
MTSKEQKEEIQLSELNELKRMQKAGEITMMRANIDSSVKIPAHEYDNYVVVRTLQRNLNPDQKSFTDIVKNIKVHADRFDAMVDAGGFVTFDDVKIVHDPREAPREKYEFRPQTINKAALSAAATPAAPSPRINKELEKKVKDLEAKEGDLADRESSINQKEQDVTDRMNELAAKEKELAEREAALKSTPAPAAEETVKTPDPGPAAETKTEKKK